MPPLRICCLSSNQLWVSKSPQSEAPSAEHTLAKSGSTLAYLSTLTPVLGLIKKIPPSTTLPSCHFTAWALISYRCLNETLFISHLWFSLSRYLPLHPYCPAIHHTITHHFILITLSFLSCFVRISAPLGNVPEALGLPLFSPTILGFVWIKCPSFVFPQKSEIPLSLYYQSGSQRKEVAHSD